jgi:molecular chaperone Hsp33
MAYPMSSLPVRRVDDLIQPFQVETMAAQGRLVRLGAAANAILSAHDYPEPVAMLLGECLTLAALLAGAFKYQGILTLQAKGDGPVSLLVADITSDGAMRGYAQYDKKCDAAKLGGDEGGSAAGATGPVPRLLGSGHLAITLDQGGDSQRHQGLVELDGATLADCAHNYLRRSVQRDAVVKLVVARTTADETTADESGRGGAGAPWRTGGLMIQRMPDYELPRISGEDDDPDSEDAWRRAVILMGSSTSEELLDPALHPHRLLYRLFHKDGVRVFKPVALEMRCRCSLERVTNVLKSFPRGEIEDMKIGGEVVVKCEFCNADYTFDDDALDALYAA